MSINFQEEDGFPYEGPNSLTGMAEHLANAETAYELLRMYAEELGVMMVGYPNEKAYRLMPPKDSGKILVHRGRRKAFLQIPRSRIRAMNAVDLIRDIRAGRLFVAERTEDDAEPYKF